MTFSKNPTANVIAGVIVIIAISVKIILYIQTPSPKIVAAQSRNEADQVAQRLQNVAETLVSQLLKAPSTARFGPVRIFKSAPPWYQVKVSVDAQNSFGALVRENYVCTFRLETDKRFTSHLDFGVCPAGGPRENPEVEEILFENWREMSGWGSTAKSPKPNR